ncbi:ABC transporter substrate-binding protein [Halosimplex litoreum]|uniref:ABC transporter substrate-binding protein n=1 Tax=Halosimplex litoreum TaxID=1198301 RepID=A0A7T3G0U5_9EURY|nr:ABC transporter substrate-binding protein [Halosimplex litoreum]QPV64296.1 ABC transporter substrate-binding protein [Halosimplex litoreum]
MHDGTDGERTRREVVRAGVGLAAAGALAGCLGGSDSTGTPTPEAGPADGADPTPTTPTDDPTAQPSDGTATESVTATETATTTPSGPYSVELAPMGEVRFESTPESIFTILSSHADMALALGRGDDVNAVYAVDYTNSLMNAFTPALDGVTVDWSDCFASWNPPEEKVYELDSDVHLADPANVATMGNWDRESVETVADTVGPWFGNTFSAQHGSPPDAYADAYEYYTLWETFGGVARALRETARYEALTDVRADLLATVEAGLPPESERPSVAMVLPSTAGDGMWTYDVNALGYHAAHTRPLGATDAFGADVANGAKVDYEGLAEADPDVLLVLGGVVDAHDMAAIRDSLEDDPVAGTVTAVEEGRVHAQGTRHQGPLLNLFQIEMGAKQLYPEAFGEWPSYTEGAYPDLATDDQLFDHDTVADIITGQ